MNDDSDPSFSEEIADLPEWDRSFWLSRAFIEASRCLCEDMLNGDFSSQYSSSRVILHLARQGIELFFKAALGAAGQDSGNLGHNLEALFIAYRQAYPSTDYFVEIPQRFKVDLTLDLFPQTMKAFHITLDQRHRYAASKRGESFATPEVFDPVEVQAEVEELDRVFKIIEWSKLRPALSGNVP